MPGQAEDPTQVDSSLWWTPYLRQNSNRVTTPWNDMMIRWFDFVYVIVIFYVFYLSVANGRRLIQNTVKSYRKVNIT
jgi:hypothetical protein